MAEMEKIDLGHGHSYTKLMAHDSDEWIGIIEWHDQADGTPCGGSVMFEGHPRIRDGVPGPTWTVHQRDPLHLEPSILCDCGEHGFIREGRWVPA